MNNNPFFKLTAEMAKEIRGIRLTAAEWRLWSYLVTLDPFGDRYVELPDMLTIMAECGMSKATAYRTIAKFQEHNLFDFQAQIKFRNLRAEKVVSKMRLDSQNCETDLKNETPAAQMRQPSAETTTQQASDSSQTPQTFFKTTDSCAVVDGKELEEEVQPTAAEVRTVFTKLQGMGLNLNPTIRSTVKKYFGNADAAIANIKQRLAQGEKFGCLEAAFVDACKKGIKSQMGQSKDEWDLFNEWCKLAINQGVIWTSMRGDDGRLFVIARDNLPVPFEQMLARYPIELLRGGSAAPAAPQTEEAPVILPDDFRPDPEIQRLIEEST